MVCHGPVGGDTGHPDDGEGDYVSVRAAGAVCDQREDRGLLPGPLLRAWAYLRGASDDAAAGGGDDQRAEAGGAREGAGAVRGAEAEGAEGEASECGGCSREGAVLGCGPGEGPEDQG